MNLKQQFSLTASKTLLVCETDGFSLRGAVLARAGMRIVVLYQAVVQQVDMDAALADLVSALRNDGWKGAGQSILLSPAVLSTLVELPVDPKRPRPLPQMAELVRWEVEPLLLQHMTRWSVGHLLVGRGYMTQEQADAVMDLQQGKPNPAGGLALQDKYSFRRFGDLAEELGYITRSQLNACLTGQEWLKSDDERIECSWVAQDAVPDVPGTFNWLVSCVNMALLRRWVDLFARQGIRLKALYPLTGNSATLMPKVPGSEVLLESHRGQAFIARFTAGRVTAMHSGLHPDKPALDIGLESYHAIHVTPNEPVWLASWQRDAEALAAELTQVLAVTVNVLGDPALDSAVSPGMLGAARVALDLEQEGRCLGVREGGPLPPLLQRLEVRAAVLAVGLLLAIVMSEVGLAIRHEAASNHKREIDARWESIDEARKRIKQQIAAIDKRKAKLKEQKASEARWKAMLDFYNEDIPARVALVQGLLSALQSSVSDEVVVFSIKEVGSQPVNEAIDRLVEVESFTLSAWALSEAGAQTFIQAMQSALRPLRMEVRDTPVNSGKGPLNLDGYALNMRLVRTLPADELAQAGV